MGHWNATGVRRALAVAFLIGAAGCETVLGPAGDDLLVPSLGEDHLTEAQRLAYQEDALRLTLRHLEASGAAALFDVEPPTALVQGLYDSLVRVAGVSHPARDSVVDLYRIHTFPHPATREIMVRVDPAFGWTAAWNALRSATGEPAVDRLLAEHRLTVVWYYEWSIGDVALLRAAAPLNAAALAARFEPIAGVIWAEPNSAGGDGNDIRARPHYGGWRLDYSVGFGDCPAGCISRHTWSFAVGPDGGVRYLGSSGPAPPSPS